MTNSEREAYNSGVIAHINGLTLDDNPYKKASRFHYYWIKGHSEKGSINKYKGNQNVRSM